MLAVISIVILYFILERNFSESTVIIQQAGLDKKLSFPVKSLLEPESKHFTYSMWIQIARINFSEALPRTIISRYKDITIKMKHNEPTLIIDQLTIDKFPLQKFVYLTICVTEKTRPDEKTPSYSIVDVYIDGKLLKSMQTNDVITPDAVSGVVVGSELKVPDMPTTAEIAATGIDVQLPPWGTIYGLQRWSYYMLPKKVNEEFNRSKLMYKKDFDINISLLKNEVEMNKYKLF